MNNAVLKLAQKIANDEVYFESARQMPLPFKMKIFETIETEQNKSIWKFLKRGPAQSGSTFGVAFYLMLVGAEAKAKEAREDFLADSGTLDLDAVKCKILDCNKSELKRLEAYYKQNPIVVRELVEGYRAIAGFLDKMPPFSWYL